MKEPYLVEQGMTERNVSDSELLLQREILRLIEKRKRQYGKCYIRSVLLKEKDTLVNACTRIELLRSDSVAPILTHYTYDDLEMRSYVTETSDLIQLLDRLLKDGVLKLPDSQVRYDGSLRKVEFFTLNSSDNPVFKIGYPFDPFYFIPTDQSKIRMPSRRPLVAVDQPLFPDSYDAAKTFLGFDLRQWSQFNGSVLFLLPNFSARISNVEIGSDHVKVSITPQFASEDQLVGKLYADDLVSTTKTQTFGFNNGVAQADIGFKPRSIWVAVLSKSDSEIIDQRQVWTSWASLPADVRLEVTQESIEEIIKQGENEQVEFKLDFGKDNKNREEFVETIVAFANTKGGMILVGVDDHGNPRGMDNEKAEETTRNLIRDHCEVPIEPEVSLVTIQGKNVAIIRVQEGTNKPYTLRNRGVIIRSGSTDRVASRFEIDAMYQNRGLTAGLRTVWQ